MRYCASEKLEIILTVEGARDAKSLAIAEKVAAENAVALAQQTQAEELAKIEKIMSFSGGMAAAKIIAEITQEDDLTYYDAVSPSR